VLRNSNKSSPRGEAASSRRGPTLGWASVTTSGNPVGALTNRSCRRLVHLDVDARDPARLKRLWSLSLRRPERRSA
jgi:hypothetical protein